jgi:ABC-2 type transport system ATP-binding protein
MQNAVEISQVSKQYGGLLALDRVDFTIPQGSFFGLLGPNGAGKSTLINIMAGLVYASAGSIRVMGHDVRHGWRQARRAVGIVPQELVYDPFFSVRELLRLQSGYFGLGADSRVWIDELLEILSLTPHACKNMHKLSGGMKRRALIAQALVHKPAVVVLDEPTAGVDVELRRLLWEFVRKLHGQGHTILLTTHYLEEAETLCEKIAILHQGKLVALDTKDALVQRLPYRFLCLHLENPLAELPPALLDKVAKRDGDKLMLRLHRERDSVGAVLESLLTAKVYFKDLRTDEPGLEEIFLAITARQPEEAKP